jgi:NADH-quinone oxidoreductase subunit C
MSDKLPGEEKTISDPVEGADSAPEAGLEREDAQPGPQPPVTRRGMWSDGSPDTSGYGEIVREYLPKRYSARPLDEADERVVARLESLVTDPFSHVLVDRGELTLFVPREKLIEVVTALRDDAHLRYEGCMSVSGVNYPTDDGAELHSVYHLQSFTHNRRLRVEVTCPDADPHIPSVCRCLPRRRLARAGDLGHVRHHLRRPPVFDPHPDAGRLGRPPPAKDYPLGGIPVEYKGAVVPPPDQRRTYR